VNDLWSAIKDEDPQALGDVLAGSPELAELTLNSNPWRVEPDESYRSETRPVHTCSLAGREKLLKVLLQYEPDLEVLTFEENKGITTPLVLAAWEGSLESCRLLLEAGANPNTWASSESPLYAAAEHHAWDKVDLLVRHGAKHDIFTACICGEAGIVESEIKAYEPLLERKSTKRNRTPLEEAVEHEQNEIVTLIERLS
jgi:hypothetical protein